LWGARAGYLLSVLSSALPAWTTFDPVPVLDSEAVRQQRQQARQEQSLQDLLMR